MTFSHSARGRLTGRDLGRFPSAALFDRIGRAVCRAGCLPRKELYEAWEVARRVRRRFRGGRVIDLAAGHGLLGQILLVLDDSSPSVVAIDKVIPSSAPRLHASLVEDWPRLTGRIRFVEAPLDSIAIAPADLVVSAHACGRLTDVVLDLAAAAGARVAVLPCCHDKAACDDGGLTGWMDAALAIDATRARRLVERGYDVRTQRIAANVTQADRLLLGDPGSHRARRS